MLNLPSVPTSIKDTGLNEGFLFDLILKHIYQAAEISGKDLEEKLKLPFSGVIEPLVLKLRAENLIEVKKGATSQAVTWIYAITDKGHLKVQEIFKRDMYIGPAPVSLKEYCAKVREFLIDFQSISKERIYEAFSDLIVSEELVEQIGPAVNSGQSLFLYGKPGNGKTSIAERICRSLGGSIIIPYAIEADNQVIKFYDPFYHIIAEDKKEEKKEEPAQPSILKAKEEQYDKRWLKVHRPMIVVGGELNLEELDLIFDERSKTYEAPFQLKSNNGVLLIDDFGRQQCRPQDLLNRWIVPLEKKNDYLTLYNGKKIEVPFNQLIAFSTNIEPADLVDEAFLRRLRYKIEIVNPNEEEYKEIFKLVCGAKKVDYDEGLVNYLIEEHYKKADRELRGCHPRDLIEQVLAIGRYKGAPATLNKEFLDYAVKTYFVEL